MWGPSPTPKLLQFLTGAGIARAGNPTGIKLCCNSDHGLLSRFGEQGSPFPGVEQLWAACHATGLLPGTAYTHFPPVLSHILLPTCGGLAMGAKAGRGCPATGGRQRGCGTSAAVACCMQPVAHRPDCICPAWGRTKRHWCRIPASASCGTPHITLKVSMCAMVSGVQGSWEVSGRHHHGRVHTGNSE